jgi:P4 family phage/plasmid primase-like protien
MTMNIAVDRNEAFRAEVRGLRDRGFQVVRLRAGTKMAFEKDWPKLTREAGDFEPGDNVGLRFGPQSGGLTDIDLDYPTARQLAGRPVFGVDRLVEFGRASLPAGQRGHRLAIVPAGPDQSRVFGIRSKEAAAVLKQRGLGLTVVEIRGSHGSQTAVPPSVICAEGKKPDRLVWTNPNADIPEMGWTELNRRVGLLAFAALGAAVYPDAESGDRDAFCAALFGSLLEAGVDMRDASHMVEEIWRVAGDEASRDIALDHDGEGLAEFLALAGLDALDHVIRPWLGLSPAPDDSDMASEGNAGDGTHTSGDTAAGVIGADELKRLLNVLDPCDFADYDSHRSMLHAAHHATGGDRAACDVFVAWCGRNPDFGLGKRDQSGKLWSDVVRAMWNRTKLARDGSAPVNTIGTIFHHAREAGYGELAEEIRYKIALETDKKLLDAHPVDLSALPDDAPDRAVWPRPVAYPGSQGAKNARLFIVRRPARLLYSDKVLYSLGSDGVWNELEEDALRAEIRATDPGDNLSPAQVGAMVQAVQDLSFTAARPFDWIDRSGEAPKPRDLVLFSNGLLDLGSDRLLLLDGGYFATAVPDFAYDPEAQCPQWLKWIGERLDKAFHPTLQEFFGYAMVPDTTVHRFVTFTGPPRSGKSTSKNILERLVGRAHISQKQLSDLGKEFGLQDAIDKRLIVIPDARDVSGGQRGQALERLLAITGGDTLSIPRKFLPAVSISLLTRLLVLGNRQPAWIDESGALAARQIAILFDRSFEGKEDQSVEDRLMTELPGIANWAIEGLRRLRANGYRFTVSERGREAVAEVRRNTSPALRFAEDCLVVTGNPNDVVLQDDVYRAYGDWVGREGLGGRELRSKTELMIDLATSLHNVQATQRRGLPAPANWRGGEYRPRVLAGVKAARRLYDFDALSR